MYVFDPDVNRESHSRAYSRHASAIEAIASNTTGYFEKKFEESRGFFSARSEFLDLGHNKSTGKKLMTRVIFLKQKKSEMLFYS